MAVKNVCRGPAALTRMTVPSSPMLMISAVVVEVRRRSWTPALSLSVSLASGSLERATQDDREEDHRGDCHREDAVGQKIDGVDVAEENESSSPPEWFDRSMVANIAACCASSAAMPAPASRRAR